MCEVLSQYTIISYFFRCATIGSKLYQRGGGLFHYLNLQKSKAILSITIEELKAEIKAMEKEIDRIESSKSYALRILKDKYHLTTKDEEVLFFAD